MDLTKTFDLPFCRTNLQVDKTVLSNRHDSIWRRYFYLKSVKYSLVRAFVSGRNIIFKSRSVRTYFSVDTVSHCVINNVDSQFVITSMDATPFLYYKWDVTLYIIWLAVHCMTSVQCACVSTNCMVETTRVDDFSTIVCLFIIIIDLPPAILY
jgi:hypothetical protein